MKTIFVLLFLSAGIATTAQVHWWKGNLHTHSLWSDGDDYPEMIAQWYKTNGYHFLGLSDHNVVLDGKKWISATNNRGGQLAFDKYLERCGSKWVETRFIGATQQVRLKTFREISKLLDARGQFLMIPSEEISDNFGKKPIHLNATNLRNLIRPQGGNSVLDVLQRNVDAVLAQRRKTGQPMIPHINHPNFGWALTAEDLMQVRGERFFEVYNGHPSVHNEGDAKRISTDSMWDVALAHRLTTLKLGPLYGMAVDDSHNYHQWATNKVNPGRGWIVVRAPSLKADALIEAMEAGDFYASSGVKLTDVQRKNGRLSLVIDAEAGVTYTTRFIGTRRGFNPTLGMTHTNTLGQDAPKIGEVFAEATGASAEYTCDGDEIYVRALITSSKPKTNGYYANEVEKAWTQPILGPAATKPRLMR